MEGPFCSSPLSVGHPLGLERPHVLEDGSVEGRGPHQSERRRNRRHGDQNDAGIHLELQICRL